MLIAFSVKDGLAMLSLRIYRYHSSLPYELVEFSVVLDSIRIRLKI